MPSAFFAELTISFFERLKEISIVDKQVADFFTLQISYCPEMFQ